MIQNQINLLLGSTSFVLFLFVQGNPIFDSSLERADLLAPEICSCNMRLILNGTDGYYLRSPNTTKDPCFWEFFVQDKVAVEINCFIYALGELDYFDQHIPDPAKICSKEKDTFKITFDGASEEYCRPFHHFSKYFKREKGFILSFNYRRNEKYEAKGKSFECHIIGNFYEEPKTKSFVKNTPSTVSITSTMTSTVEDIIKSSNRSSSTLFVQDDTNRNIFNSKSEDFSECGAVNSPLHRIIGGNVVEPNQYPWMVPINVDGSNLCGGTILTPRFVLTAGHCLKGIKWVRIYFGVHEYGKYIEAQTSSDVYIHPRYNFPSHDIGLVKLAKPLIFRREIRPVCLPHKNIGVDIKVRGFGWGKTSDNAVTSSRFLKENTFTTISDERCEERFNLQLGKDIMCTESPKGQSICQGDSGSTLGRIEKEDKKFYIYGVSSFTANSCEEGYPTGFTEVYPYLDWIKKMIETDGRSIKLLETYDVLVEH